MFKGISGKELNLLRQKAEGAFVKEIGGVLFKIEPSAEIHDTATIGYADIWKHRGDISNQVVIGARVRIGIGSIIYAGVILKNNVNVNHYVCIRENTTIGKQTTIGNFTQVEGYTTIGEGCSIWSQCHITAYSKIGDNVFMAPFCCLTNDPVIAPLPA